MISCVMLTTTRRSRLRSAALAALAAQQSAPSFELVVVTDDDDPVELRALYLASGANNVVLYRKTEWEHLSAKRNAACQLASGRWVTFWDDDDWSSQWRLLVTERLSQGSLDLIGASTIFWHELTTPTRYTIEYVSPDPNYVVGGTVAFRKELWRETPFQDRPGDEGWWTIERLRNGARRGLTMEPYVAMVHGGNITNHRPFRVNAITKEVHDGSQYRWKGGREIVLDVMGRQALERFEAAVA